MKLLLITSIFINFILILTIYIIYFTNKSTEYFAAIGQDILGGEDTVTIFDVDKGTEVKESFTTKKYSTVRFSEDDSFLMNDIDGNFINFPATKLNEILNVFENNIQANTQSIETNTTNIGKSNEKIKENAVKIEENQEAIGKKAEGTKAATGLYEKIEENALKIEKNQKDIGNSRNGDNAATGLNADMDIANESLAKLNPLVEGKLCGSKNFENTRGRECRAIRYNDFMTIQNYGAKRTDKQSGSYLRVTGEKYPEFIKQSALDKKNDGGDAKNRGINTIWSIIPQATKTTTTTQPPPEQKPIWKET